MKKLLQVSLMMTSVLVLSGCDLDDDFNNPVYSSNTTTVRSVQRSGNVVTTTTRQTNVTVSPDRAPGPGMTPPPPPPPRPSRVVVRQPAPSVPAPVIAAPMPTTSAPAMTAPPITRAPSGSGYPVSSDQGSYVTGTYNN